MRPENPFELNATAIMTIISFFFQGSPILYPHPISKILPTFKHQGCFQNYGGFKWIVL